MANISFNAGTVTHTLPTYFAGIGGSTYNYQAMANASYKASFTNLNPEAIRWNPWTNAGTVATPNAYNTAFKTFALAIGSSYGIVMGPTNAEPNALPSTKNPNDTTNLRANGSGVSPSDMADWFEDFVLAGVNVIGVEPFNEPENAVHTGPGDGPWYGDGVNITDANTRKCVTFATVQHRQFVTAMRAKATAHGWTMPSIWGKGGASSQPYGIGQTQQFVDGVCNDGSTWPWPDSNYAYFDNVSTHPYGGGGRGILAANQGSFNEIFWDPVTFATQNDTVGIKAFARRMREYMDAAGQTSKTITSGEQALNAGGGNNEDAITGVWDAAFMVCSAAYQSAYKIDNIISWSFEAHPNSEGTGTLRIMDSDTWTLNTRACIMRDLVYYYSRNYKRQLISGQTAVTGSGMTPAAGENSGQNNSVPRIVAIAGLNTAGTKIGMLVCNIDLSTSETINVDWGSGAATGQITGRKAIGIGNPTVVSGTTNVPAITPISPSGTTFSQTLEPGSAYLFEIPISTVSTLPPANSSAPVVSGATIRGATLSTTNGTWTNSPTSYTYQWTRTAAQTTTQIAGATSSTYTLVLADVASTIACVVTATNSGGSTAASSAQTIEVIDQASFTNTPVVDDFNRANGAVGANWVNVQGCTITPVVNTNQLKEGTS